MGREEHWDEYIKTSMEIIKEYYTIDRNTHREECTTYKLYLFSHFR